jgi:YggT family protein
MQIPEAVNQVNMAMMARSAVGIALTLYMLAIIARWAGPWLELNTATWWMRIVARITDPLILLMRRLLPPMGPVDWGPIAALVAVWFVRILLVQY